MTFQTTPIYALPVAAIHLVLRRLGTCAERSAFVPILMMPAIALQLFGL